MNTDRCLQCLNHPFYINDEQLNPATLVFAVNASSCNNQYQPQLIKRVFYQTYLPTISLTPINVLDGFGNYQFAKNPIYLPNLIIAILVVTTII